jgi:hypothetical protein
MAHFAELDDNNNVLRVVVIKNEDTADAKGVEKEHIGAAFCERLFGGRWVKTSYNSSIRARFAGVGMIYNEQYDCFMDVQPFPSWTIDATTKDWVAPTAEPNDGKKYDWNEATLSWVERVTA